LPSSLLRLARLRIGIAHPQQQTLRRLARLHQPRPLSREGDAHTELAPLRKLALYLAEPAGETAGVRECQPQVVDIGVVAVLHAHDAFAIC
jgi:hypothetical protein